MYINSKYVSDALLIKLFLFLSCDIVDKNSICILLDVFTIHSASP